MEMPFTEAFVVVRAAGAFETLTGNEDTTARGGSVRRQARSGCAPGLRVDRRSVAGLPAVATFALAHAPVRVLHLQHGVIRVAHASRDGDGEAALDRGLSTRRDLGGVRGL